MIASYSYEVTHVVVGDRPYPDDIVPYFGSSYSQIQGTPNTVTTRIIGMHFSSKHVVPMCICESWKLLPLGYVFLNSCWYTRRPGDVRLLEIVEHMIECMVHLCSRSQGIYRSGRVRMLSMCSIGRYVVVTACARLRAMGIDCTATHAIQPAALDRYTFNRDLIGIDERYMSFTPSGMTFLDTMAQGFIRVQSITKSDVDMSGINHIKHSLVLNINIMLQEHKDLIAMVEKAWQESDLAVKMDNLVAALDKLAANQGDKLKMLSSAIVISTIITDQTASNALASAPQRNTIMPRIPNVMVTTAGMTLAATVSSQTTSSDPSTPGVKPLPIRCPLKTPLVALPRTSSVTSAPACDTPATSTQSTVSASTSACVDPVTPTSSAAPYTGAGVPQSTVIPAAIASMAAKAGMRLKSKFDVSTVQRKGV